MSGNLFQITETSGWLNIFLQEADEYGRSVFPSRPVRNASTATPSTSTTTTTTTPKTSRLDASATLSTSMTSNSTAGSNKGWFDWCQIVRVESFLIFKLETGVGWVGIRSFWEGVYLRVCWCWEGVDVEKVLMLRGCWCWEGVPVERVFMFRGRSCREGV